METAHLNSVGESISIYSQTTSCDIKPELRVVLKMLQIKECSNSTGHNERMGHYDNRSRKSILICKNKQNNNKKKNETPHQPIETTTPTKTGSFSK